MIDANIDTVKKWSKSIVFKSKDNRKTWKSVLELEPPGSNVKNTLDFKNNSALLATTYDLYVTYDLGDTWKKLTNSAKIEGLYPINGLYRSNNDYYLLSDLAFYKMKKDSLEQLLDIKDEIEKTELEAPPIWLYEPYPNPSNKSISFDMIWDKRYNSNDIEISIYNIYGSKIRNIKNLNKNYLLDNKVNISFEFGDLPTGIYQICASIKNYKRFVSFVVIK